MILAITTTVKHERKPIYLTNEKNDYITTTSDERIIVGYKEE